MPQFFGLRGGSAVLSDNLPYKSYAVRRLQNAAGCAIMPETAKMTEKTMERKFFSSYIFAEANKDDLPHIISLYRAAGTLSAEQGMTWSENYPSSSDACKDFSKRSLFVLRANGLKINSAQSGSPERDACGAAENRFVSAAGGIVGCVTVNEEQDEEAAAAFRALTSAPNAAKRGPADKAPGTYPFAAQSPAAFLHRLCIHPQMRGMGLSKHLLSGAESVAAAHGATRCVLDVYEKNTAALALYKGAGYETVSEFYRDGVLYLLMQKSL